MILLFSAPLLEIHPALLCLFGTGMTGCDSYCSVKALYGEWQKKNVQETLMF